MIEIENVIKKFVKERSGAGILLALSGGPDSIALFHLFMKEQIVFHVAHVNHNWRSESSAEAIQLQTLCLEKKIPFYCKSLFPEKMKEGNLEDLCRKERLVFFKELIDQHNLEGVVTGHHSDDQAETVLKRLFEGASLSKLKGLASFSSYEGMTIFRPLLTVRKKDILEWLNHQKIPYFSDCSNDNTLYLRARMRKELFPQISTLFGKEIVPSLVRISQASEELEDFLEHFLKPYRQKYLTLNNKFSFDLSEVEISTIFAWKSILRDFFSFSGLTVSKPTLEMVIFLLQNGKGEKKIIIGNRCVTVFKKTITVEAKRLISRS